MRSVLLISSLSSLSIYVYAQDLNTSLQNNFSISGGYIGGFENLSDDKDKLNGFFVSSAIQTDPRVSFYTEYNHEKMSILKFNELSFGVQYKFYDRKKFNGSFGTGIGYMWLDQELHDPHMNLSADLRLNYIAIPIFVESEAKLTENISYFSNLSYKWLFSHNSKVCISSMGIQTMCESINENSNGLLYKLGMRYRF
ncbi:hypothetical protein [Acinetobacter rudis]|uniref:hypothetical protein n=1 Tax=Acinetobacter rudis TaxID=632955 RepID=UPI00333F068C